ncbi:MAG: hypothetical protein E6G08_14130 [Actinobacteria bacterium]|nr:MAG: hypothetical protein E6G08_14130 [Actinomycetota bacterium]
MSGPPRRFYLVAVGAGFAFASMAIAVPLHVVAAHAQASVAGDVLALGTIAVAVGALAAGRLGSGALGVALAVAAGGSATLVAATSVVPLAVGAVVVGAGIGMFWVASQLILARRAGEPDGAKAYLLHYAAYTFGAVAGSTVTSALALAGAVFAAVVWRGCARYVVSTLPQPAGETRSRQLAVQVPDLLLVSALALLLPLVLACEFGLAPFSIGIVMGSVALAKIVGPFVARAITRTRAGAHDPDPPRRERGVLRAALLRAYAVALRDGAARNRARGTGAWPLVVDAAQARVEPAERRTLTVRWNAREYVLMPQ